MNVLLWLFFAISKEQQWSKAAVYQCPLVTLKRSLWERQNITLTLKLEDALLQDGTTQDSAAPWLCRKEPNSLPLGLRKGKGPGREPGALHLSILTAMHPSPARPHAPPAEHRNIFLAAHYKNIFLLDIDFQEVLITISSGSRNSRKTN